MPEINLDTEDVIYLDLTRRAETARRVLDDAEPSYDDLLASLQWMDLLSEELTLLRGTNPGLGELDDQVGEWKVAVVSRMADASGRR